MKLTEYVIKCVDDYIENTKGGNGNLRVFIDCTKNIGYEFVQIGGVIYIPNCKEPSSNGTIIRSTDLVDGWEDFGENEIKTPLVKQIIVRRRHK